MKRRHYIYIVLFLVLVSGCSDEHFEEVNPHQSIIASMNILQPSLSFYNNKAQQVANWAFEKAYTGATLVGYDTVFLYGHQLNEADLYELSSGKKIKSIDTGLGVTNAYYDENSEQLFVTNSQTNEVKSYTEKGKLKKSLKLRNYPMSMTVSGDYLYVINYKDTMLSVVLIQDLQLFDEWEIAKSSHGIVVLPEENRLWIGGHGEGSSPNQTVDLYDLTTGSLVDELKVPLMPVGFTQQQNEIAIISHGANELSLTDTTGAVKWQLEVAANPFAVEYFNDYIVVAGYDDQTLYFVKNGVITETISTEKGPFQLLVREE